jgi:hypothetical protein
MQAYDRFVWYRICSDVISFFHSSTKQYARTDIRKYSFGVRVVEPWNKRDQGTKNCVEKRKFKAKIKAKPSIQMMIGKGPDTGIKGSRLDIRHKCIEVEG